MERRAASHTEEEEMDQRRHLLELARKGDLKAISKLFELYQVRVVSGDAYTKGRIPKWPGMHPAKAPAPATHPTKPAKAEPAPKRAKAAPARPAAKRTAKAKAR